jgi:exoribonuclease-2
MQIELDSGKRVKVKAANVLLRFDKPAPAELIAPRRSWPPTSTSTWPGNSPPTTSSALPTWRATTSTPRPAPSSRRQRCSACSRRRTTSAAPARAVPQGARGDRQGRAAGHRAQEADRRADRGLGRRAGRRPVPAAGARAALPHPVQARQERARVQGRGRGRQARAARAAGPAADRRRHRQPLPVPLAALPVRAVPQGHRLPGAGGAGHQGRTAAGRVQAFSIDDSATTEIDDALSVQGLGSGTVVFGIHIAAPALAIAPDSPRSTRWRATACPPSTCRAGS